MRNGTYTLYNGRDFELHQEPDGRYKLICRKSRSCPPDFQKYNQQIFYKVVPADEITNAFYAVTFAIYRGYEFQVSKIENEWLQLTTSDEQAYRSLNLDFIDRGYYEKWVVKGEVNKIWEVRRMSGYGFPFPEGLKESEEIVP